jgi:hypothetical protein
MSFEQSGAVVFVLVPRSGEFVWVQCLAQVVGRRTEKEGITVESETSEPCGKAIEKLDGSTVNEDQMSDEERRCPKFFAEASSYRG